MYIVKNTHAATAASKKFHSQKIIMLKMESSRKQTSINNEEEGRWYCDEPSDDSDLVCRRRLRSVCAGSSSRGAVWKKNEHDAVALSKLLRHSQHAILIRAKTRQNSKMTTRLILGHSCQTVSKVMAWSERWSLGQSTVA